MCTTSFAVWAKRPSASPRRHAGIEFRPGEIFRKQCTKSINPSSFTLPLHMILIMHFTSQISVTPQWRCFLFCLSLHSLSSTLLHLSVWMPEISQPVISCNLRHSETVCKFISARNHERKWNFQLIQVRDHCEKVQRSKCHSESGACWVLTNNESQFLR